MSNSFRNLVNGRVLYAADGVGVGEIGSLCVVIWRQGVTRERFEQQRAGLTEVVRRHPQGVGFMCVIEPTTKPPDDRLRKASLEMITALGPKLRCLTVVIEGEGFRAAITRSVISGMALLLPRQTPGTAAESAHRAAKWMAAHMPLESTDKVVEFVENLRGMLAPYEEGR